MLIDFGVPFVEKMPTSLFFPFVAELSSKGLLSFLSAVAKITSLESTFALKDESVKISSFFISASFPIKDEMSFPVLKSTVSLSKRVGCFVTSNS